jgi:hypothetical protein
MHAPCARGFPRSRARTSSIPLGWCERIGTVMGTGDHWWNLDAAGRLRGRVSTEVGDAVPRFAPAAIQERISGDAR